MKQKIKITLPWIFCILIFIFIFSKIPPAEVLTALKLLNIPLFLLFALGYFFTVFIFDCLTLKHFISRFAVPISLRECLLMRGVSYLIMVLNFQLSQVAFAVYLKKYHKTPLPKTLGTLLYINIADVILIVTFMLGALYFFGDPTQNGKVEILTLKIVPLIYVGFLSWIFFWKNTDSKLVKILRKIKPINWILTHEIFFTFREATLKDYLILLWARIPLVFIFIGSYNLAVISMRGFIEWVPMYIYNSIIMFVGCLPITPAGLGSVQILVMEFFTPLLKSPIVDHGLITAENFLMTSSLIWILSNQVLKIIFGSFCLLKTQKKSIITRDLLDES